MIIISSTLILAGDWSIAVVYWIVFHCFSLIVNVRIRISVLFPFSMFIPLRHGYYGFDLKFIGHSLVFFLYHKIQNKNEKHKIEKNNNK